MKTEFYNGDWTFMTGKPKKRATKVKYCVE
jgi:hypothetical protein